MEYPKSLSHLSLFRTDIEKMVKVHDTSLINALAPLPPSMFNVIPTHTFSKINLFSEIF